MIEISHLTKKYGANVAVNDLSLTLEPGNIYGFLGPNGAGKSTTMNIITGYIGASSGEVKINGYDINKNPEEAKKCNEKGIDAFFSILPGVCSLDEAMDTEIAQKNMRNAAEQVFRLILALLKEKCCE